MARLTRQAARLLASPSTNATTPSTDISPVFSAQPSVRSETPNTDPGFDEGLPVAKKPIRNTARSTASNKRSRTLESDDLDSDQDQPATKPAAKRRQVSRQVYVEVPATKASKGKGKAKSIPSPSPPPIKNKGKGKAKAPVDEDDEDEDDVLSDPLEYDEAASLQESDDSGSEFLASSDDEPLEVDEDDDEEGEQDVVPRASPRKNYVIEDVDDHMSDIDDEDLMMDAAIRLSLQTAHIDAAQSTGASSSRPRPSLSSSPAAALRAAAAERRLAQAKEEVIDVDYLSDFDDAVSSDLSDEPLQKGKGKSKAKGSKKVATKSKASRAVAIRDTSKPTHMTVAEHRNTRREARRLATAAKRANKQEELALMRKLGRRLTYAEKSSIALRKHHPELKDVWGDLEESIPIIVPQKAEQPANLKVQLLPFQNESLFWMRTQEQGVWNGGMLADEMGMGKTIQIIALFVSDLQKPNLVVAPTVAIMQWRNEIATHTAQPDGSPLLKVLIWHGAGRDKDIKELRKYDVVLTTYAVLESCYRKQEKGFKRGGHMIKEKSPLHQIKWNRIVLDEAHNIKERSTNTAKAAFELDSNFKWCLSGTPLQNRVGELYSLVRFLGGDPFSYYFCKQCPCKSLHWQFSNHRHCDECGHSPMQHTCFWNNEILTPIQKNGMAGPGKDAFKKLKILLDRMMLRRTKIQRADDLGLPPRTVIVRRDWFSPEEKELYLSLFSDAKRQFTTYLDQGTVLNNYSNIFSLLTRMRQMACHPDLVLRSKTNASKFIPESDGEATVCRICNDVAEDAIQSKCRHIFDRECIKQYLDTALEQNPDCPVCHVPLTIDLEAPALELEENVPNARQGILGRLNLETWRSSSKIEALLEELSNLRMQDATTKSLVFSQFVNFLDLIAYRLQKAGFNICRLEGTMSPQARDATIQHFMKNVGVTVFLVSLKAGGVALNLTEASRVYLMDSWWNPAVEYQAMDRIHRLGQHRPVQAIKLVIEDSIESRIVQLQEKKSAMVDATLSTDDSAMGRLTPEDLGFLFRL